MGARDFPVRVEWAKRVAGGGSWISVGDPDTGPHFQCDYLGDHDEGPRSVRDFAERPPSWVVEALGLA